MRRDLVLVLALVVSFVAGCGGGGGGSSSSKGGLGGSTGGSSGGSTGGSTGGGGGGIPIGTGPIVNTVTPPSAPPGTSVTIAGSGFSASKTFETVRFGSAIAGIQSTSATQIVAVVPSVATGSAPVTVEVGGVASAAVAFTVTAPLTGTPVLGSLSPASGPVGAQVTLSGSNLGAVVAVRFGAQTISTTAGPRFVVPSAPPASYPVVAVDSAGGASGPISFVLTPVLSSLSVASAKPGDALTLTGTNFGAQAVEVRFGGLATAQGTPTGGGGTSVLVTVPSPFPASLPVSITVTVAANPGTPHAAESNALAFTVNAPPGGQPATITQLTPSSGPTGTVVQVSGANFGSAPAVTIGGAAAAVSNATATSL
ncbi:MAG TPA: IPT/TIG domain-containing protein, partial [Planctomycetota bacterium]|nr:IPT/TIG domain-containing protein [Planctomycetota bacterium]